MLTGVTSTDRSAADVTEDKARGGGGYLLTGVTSTGRSAADVTKDKARGGGNSTNYMLTGVTSTGRLAADVTKDKARGGGGYMLKGVTSTGRLAVEVTERKSDGGKSGVKSGKDKTHASHKKAHKMEFKRWYDCKTCGKRYSSGAKNPVHQLASKPPCTQSGSTGTSVCCNSRVCKCDGEGNLH